MVTPSYMLSTMDEYAAQGLDPGESPLRIESAFGIHAVDIYGLSEIVGPGVANECVETKDGPHIWEDHFYPEVIDPRTGEALLDGESGELVFTTLSKEAMPLVVRYRTRDLTRLLPGTARTMRRMEKETGRSDDMTILRGVNLSPSQFEEIILSVGGLAQHFQLKLVTRGRLDALKVQVKSLPEHADASSRKKLAKILKDRIRNSAAVSVDFDILEPGRVARSADKAVRLVDARNAR